MKKIFALLLTLLMVATLAGCGKSEAVKETEALIKEIGEVELGDLAAIEKAEASFNALSSEEQAQVGNYDTLTEAQQHWDYLRTSGAKDYGKRIVEIYCDLLYGVSNSKATIQTCYETSTDKWQVRGYVSVNYGGKTYSGAFESTVSYDRDSCDYDSQLANLDKLTR